MSIGQRIRMARKALGMSQATLAGKVGLTQATLSDLENDKSKGSAKIASIASILRVRSFWLETGRGAPELDEESPALAPMPAASSPPIYSVQSYEFGYIGQNEEYAGSLGAFRLGEGVYCLRIKGNILGDRIETGDILVVDQDIEILPGDMVVVELTNGKRGIWRLRFDRNNESCFDQIPASGFSVTVDNSEIASLHKISAIIPR